LCLCDRRWGTQEESPDIIHLYPFVSAGNSAEIPSNSTFFAYSGKKSLKKYWLNYVPSESLETITK
jgi:hypothetical protein